MSKVTMKMNNRTDPVYRTLGKHSTVKRSEGVPLV